VTGLKVPWSLAFEGNDLYFTEREGTLWVVRQDQTEAELIARVPGVVPNGEGGLMGLAFHPDFAHNGLVYLSYSYEVMGHTANKVSRFRLANEKLLFHSDLIDRLPGAGIHDGCRIRFGPDGKLYVSTGDAAHRQIAQDMNSLGGKILRLNDDGSIPKDNPFGDSPIYSLGHRNGQGIAWHPSLGLLFETEHGPSGFDGPGGGDEINIVNAGKNYGWPAAHHEISEKGMVDPIALFTPAVAPSGASFCTGKVFPEFKNDLFVATLRGKCLLRIELDLETGRRVTRVDSLFVGVFGRLRDVTEGPDGGLYFCTNNRDGRGIPTSSDDRIIKIIRVN
jgi:aldose sugar dehydrogenase